MQCRKTIDGVPTREHSKDVVTPQNPLGVAGWTVPGDQYWVRWMIFVDEEWILWIFLDLWTGKSPSMSISPGLVSLSQSGPQPPFGWWPKPFVLPTRIKCKSKHGKKILMPGNISILPSWLSYCVDLYFQDSYRGTCQGVHFLLWKLFLTGQKTGK